MKTPVDPMYFVSAHEAGHAVAYILAHRALGRSYRSFKPIFIRRDFKSAYIDHQGREIDCSGLCEGVSHIYTPAGDDGLRLSNAEPPPGWKSELLTKMEWAILVSLAGPLAEASRIWKSKRDMHLAALFSCGSDVDYRDAETVLDDYKKLSKRRHGIRHCENRTRDLVLKSWPAIDALAKTLLVKETLDHDDAYAVVEPFLESL